MSDNLKKKLYEVNPHNLYFIIVVIIILRNKSAYDGRDEVHSA